MHSKTENETIQTRFIPRLENLAFDALVEKYGLFSMDIPTNLSPIQEQNVVSILETNLIKKLMPIFLQAVIDDDMVTCQKILEETPLLLLNMPEKDFVIESKLTWQKFIPEPALVMAAKRNQINMFELLLSYTDKLEQTDTVMKAKYEAFSAWISYETTKNKQGFNDEIYDKIVIPEKYINYVKSLMTVFKNEDFPNKTLTQLSQKTESVLMSLLDTLIPENAQMLGDYLDHELLLIAACKMFDKYSYFKSGNQEMFQNGKQEDAFCIRVIGLIVSVLQPETAKILCEGLTYLGREISERAATFRLLKGEPFYRESRESRTGQGFKYLCAPIGCAAGPGNDGAGHFDLHSVIVQRMQRLCLTKAKKFNQIKDKFIKEMDAYKQDLETHFDNADLPSTETESKEEYELGYSLS